jgi:transposase
MDIMIDWEGTAKKLGYESERKMWLDFYVARKMSVTALSEKLDVSRNSIRDALARNAVPIRKQGGPNNQKVEITDEIIEEIREKGISAVAKRLGVTYTTIYKRLYRRSGTVVEQPAPDVPEVVSEEDEDSSSSEPR